MSTRTVPAAVLRTGAALVALWALSFGLSYVHLGGASLPLALGIAVLKAALVVSVFMELLRESLSMKLTLLVAMGLLAILIGLMVADIATREPAASAAPSQPVGQRPPLE